MTTKLISIFCSLSQNECSERKKTEHKTVESILNIEQVYDQSERIMALSDFMQKQSKINSGNLIS